MGGGCVTCIIILDILQLPVNLFQNEKCYFFYLKKVNVWTKTVHSEYLEVWKAKTAGLQRSGPARASL